MKVRRLLPPLTAMLLTLVGCGQTEMENHPAAGQEILLSSRLDPMTVTRTASKDHLSTDGKHFTAGQRIALYIKGETASSAYQGGIHTMTTEESDVLNFDVGSNCYWPGENYVNFYAWCPYTTDGPLAGKKSEDAVTFTVSADQTTAEKYAANDLLYAYARAKRPSDNVTRTLLTFSHKLSQLVVVVQSADNNMTDAQLASATISLDGTLKMNAQLDLDGGTAIATGEAAATTIQMGTGSATYAVLPPGQSVKGTTVSFDLEDGGSGSYTIKNIDNLEAGKSYIITLRLKLYEISGVTEEVVDWQDGENRDKRSTPLYI